MGFPILVGYHLYNASGPRLSYIFYSKVTHDIKSTICFICKSILYVSILCVKYFESAIPLNAMFQPWHVNPHQYHNITSQPAKLYGNKRLTMGDGPCGNYHSLCWYCNKYHWFVIYIMSVRIYFVWAKIIFCAIYIELDFSQLYVLISCQLVVLGNQQVKRWFVMIISMA